MANIIKEIPAKALSHIVNTYVFKGEFALIQKLITSIDITSVDCAPLITISLNNGLTQSLIYCCTKGREYDFFTPLTRLWGVFISFFLNGNNNEDNTFFLDKNNDKENNNNNSNNKDAQNDQHNDEFYVDEYLENQRWEKHRKFGIQALWYLRLCLRKEYITKETIPEEIYLEILKEIF